MAAAVAAGITEVGEQMKGPIRGRVRRLLCLSLSAILVAAVPGPSRAGEAGSTLQDPPGAQALVTAMEAAFAGVTDYQCKVSAHILNGRDRTEIEGSFYFRRPRQVLLKMGAKGGVVFRKDGRIRAWFLTRLFAHDHRPEDRVLRDARGRRLDEYVMGDLIAELKSLLEAGARASVAERAWRGKRVFALDVTPPGGRATFSRRTYWVAAEALLPLGHETFQGAAKVEDVWCEGLKLNVGLDDGFFH